MAVVKMSKLLLVSTSNDRKKIFKEMHKMGCVEISSSSLSEGMQHTVDSSEEQEVLSKLASLDFAFNLHKELSSEIKNMVKKDKIKKYKGIKRPSLSPIPEIDVEKFYGLEDNEKEVFDKIDELKEIDDTINSIRAEKAKKLNIITQLKPYKNVDVRISLFRDLENVSIGLGLLQPNKVEDFKKLEEKYDTLQTHIFGQDKQIPIAYIIWKDDAQSLLDDLAKLDFVQCSLSEKGIPKETIEKLEKEIVDLEKERVEQVKKVMTYENNYESFRLYHDYYQYQKGLKDIEKTLGSTKEVTLFEAWLPETQVSKLDDIFGKSKMPLYYETYKPQEDEEPPTFIKGNAITTPYQSITNMLEAPRYKEVDPNPFVTVFFIFMSGLMLGDAGYGIVLTLLSGFILLKTKPKRGKGNLIKIIFMLGISTIFWGIMFGTYFGLTSTNSIGQPGIINGAIAGPAWFDILAKPLRMMIFSVLIGLTQLLVGVWVKGYVFITREKNYVRGITHPLSWTLLVLGLVIMMFKALVGQFGPDGAGAAFYMPKSVKLAGKIIALLGVILIAVDGALSQKKLKRLSGAFSNLYGIINLLADALSYTRLFGLGLATGVIGFVFNQIGFVLIGLIPYIGWIIAIVFCIFGHIFNIAINTLGTYVHDSRLQFVEFFGKFYEGGGTVFKPLGSDIKYYEIKGIQDINKVETKNKKQKNK